VESEGYELFCNLCTPANLTLERLAEIMQKYLQPQLSVILQRYKFKECKQMEGEDFKTYLAKLKKLSHSTLLLWGTVGDPYSRPVRMGGLAVRRSGRDCWENNS